MVNIASVNGMSVFGHPAYSAAKAGLLHFTRLVAVEYGKFGIRSNAVAPGTVNTQAWEARAAANPNVFEDARRWYPLQRVVDPKDVADAVALSRRSPGGGDHRRLPAGRLRPDGRSGRACPHLSPNPSTIENRRDNERNRYETGLLSPGKQLATRMAARIGRNLPSRSSTCPASRFPVSSWSIPR